jgi:hypothetical protein
MNGPHGGQEGKCTCCGDYSEVKEGDSRELNEEYAPLRPDCPLPALRPAGYDASEWLPSPEIFEQLPAQHVLHQQRYSRDVPADGADG